MADMKNDCQTFPPWVCKYLLFKNGVNANILSISFNILLGKRRRIFRQTDDAQSNDLFIDFLNAIKIIVVAKNIYLTIKKVKTRDPHNGIRTLMENVSFRNIFFTKTLSFWEQYIDDYDDVLPLNTDTLFKTAMKLLQVVKNDYLNVINHFIPNSIDNLIEYSAKLPNNDSSKISLLQTRIQDYLTNEQNNSELNERIINDIRCKNCTLREEITFHRNIARKDIQLITQFSKLIPTRVKCSTSAYLSTTQATPADDNERTLYYEQMIKVHSANIILKLRMFIHFIKQFTLYNVHLRNMKGLTSTLDINIVNVMSHTETECNMDLDKVLLNCRTSTYVSVIQPVVEIRSIKPTAILSVYPYGKITCINAITVKESTDAINKCLKLLERLGFPIVHHEILIYNIIATCYVGFDINLGTLFDVMKPIYKVKGNKRRISCRMQKPNLTVNVLKSGRLFFIGCSRMDDLYVARDIVIEKINMSKGYFS